MTAHRQPLRPVRSRVFKLSALAALALIVCNSGTISAGVVFGLGSGITGGSRWDAAPRTFNFSGTDYERSLSGGLRYSVAGGSYEAFRDMFSWSGGTPSVSDFQTTVERAFAAWTSPDPVSQFATQVSFTPDFGTAVVGVAGGGGADNRGSEIDLIASTNALFWDPGNTGTQGETWFNATGGGTTLTSGTAGYAGFAITGADVIINSNPGALYTLDFFGRLLTHELGHALGFGDVENSINPGRFIDDNYDPTNSATALATLTNSWTALVNTANPTLSPLSLFTVANGDPGVGTTGVNILMESNNLGIAAGNPVTNLIPLTNDEYGIRQFLYPSTIKVPEPGTLVTAGIGLALLAGYRWRRRRASR